MCSMRKVRVGVTLVGIGVFDASQCQRFRFPGGASSGDQTGQRALADAINAEHLSAPASGS